jgi:hypothetical protein
MARILVDDLQHQVRFYVGNRCGVAALLHACDAKIMRIPGADALKGAVVPLACLRLGEDILAKTSLWITEDASSTGACNVEFARVACLRGTTSTCRDKVVLQLRVLNPLKRLELLYMDECGSIVEMVDTSNNARFDIVELLDPCIIDEEVKLVEMVYQHVCNSVDPDLQPNPLSRGCLDCWLLGRKFVAGVYFVPCAPNKLPRVTKLSACAHFNAQLLVHGRLERGFAGIAYLVLPSATKLS